MTIGGKIGYGLEDLKVYVLDGSDSPGSAVDVPGIRALSFNIESDSDTLEGDNSTIATVRQPKTGTGSLELGMVDLAALAAMVGGTASTSGSTPNQIVALDEAAAANTQYFQIIGQAPGQDTNGSGYRVTIYKALVTSGPDETLTVNDWNTPTLDFNFVSKSGNLCKRQQYETKASIT